MIVAGFLKSPLGITISEVEKLLKLKIKLAEDTILAVDLKTLKRSYSVLL